MTRRVPLRCIAPLLIGLSLCVQAISAPVSVVGNTSLTIKRHADGNLPETIEIPILFGENNSKSNVNVQVVRAALAGPPVPIKNYQTCLANPASGQGLWALRIMTGDQSPLAPGLHKLQIMAWVSSQANSASVCPEGGSVSILAPPVGSKCTDETCNHFDLSLTIPPVRTGSLLEFLGSHRRTLTFDDSGAPQSIFALAIPGKGVDGKQLRVKVIDIQRDGVDAFGSFDACFNWDPTKADAFLTLQITPADREIRVGKYSIVARAWMTPAEYGNGSLCGTVPKPAPTFDPALCKPKAEAGKALTCQSFIFEVTRKAGQLRVPKEIVFDVQTIPVLELFRVPKIGKYWQISQVSTPIRITETGYDGAVDLSSTNLSPSLFVAGGADPKGTVTFTSDDTTLETPLKPGATIAFDADLDLPVGYGNYTSTLALLPRLGTAIAQDMPIKINVRIVPFALMVAIVIGIFVGYFWRRKFEVDLVRDMALINARLAIQRLHKVRSEAQDAVFADAVSNVIEELQSKMHRIDATGATVTGAVKEANTALEKAQKDLAERQEKATKKLEPWRSAFATQIPEPAEIVEALKPVRTRLNELQARLDAGDAASLDQSDGLPDLPNKAKAGINNVLTWFTAHIDQIRNTAMTWAKVSSQVALVTGNVDSATTTLNEAGKKTPLSAAESEKAMADLIAVLRSHDIIHRTVLAGYAETIGVGLIDFANSHQVPWQELRTAVDALSAFVNDPNSQWDIGGFATNAHQVSREIRDILNELKKQNFLTEEEKKKLDADGHIATGKFMLESSRITGPGFDEPHIPVGAAPATAYMIIRPAIVYVNEEQPWRVETRDGSALTDEMVVWKSGDKKLGDGIATDLRLSGDDAVTVTANIFIDKERVGAPTATVTPVGRPNIDDVAALQQRVRRQKRLRALVNGIVITLLGYAFSQTVAVGYAGLIVAFIWGLSADISADKLTDVTGKT